MVRDSIALVLGWGAMQACPDRPEQPTLSERQLTVQPVDANGCALHCAHADGPAICSALECPHVKPLIAAAMASLSRGVASRVADAVGVPELAPLMDAGFRLGQISGRGRRRRGRPH